jgi:hypothetical protein
MKISELPYYVKFVFLCSDNACFSTSDIKMLEHIKSAESGEAVSYLEVGNRIMFAPNTDTIYRITSVAIKHLVDDTELMRLGFDSEDCTSMQGEEKDWLLKILIHADRE